MTRHNVKTDNLSFKKLSLIISCLLLANLMELYESMFYPLINCRYLSQFNKIFISSFSCILLNKPLITSLSSIKPCKSKCVWILIMSDYASNVFDEFVSFLEFKNGSKFSWSFSFPNKIVSRCYSYCTTSFFTSYSPLMAKFNKVASFFLPWATIYCTSSFLALILIFPGSFFNEISSKILILERGIYCLNAP